MKRLLIAALAVLSAAPALSANFPPVNSKRQYICKDRFKKDPFLLVIGDAAARVFYPGEDKPTIWPLRKIEKPYSQWDQWGWARDFGSEGGAHLRIHRELIRGDEEGELSIYFGGPWPQDFFCKRRAQ